MRRTSGWLVALAVLALLTALPATSQEKQKIPAKAGAPQGGAEMDPMVQALLEAGSPGPHHDHLAKLVGKWEVKTQFFGMGPDPVESRANALNEMVLGGRFLKMTLKGEMMGIPFVGVGHDGYDNATGKHESVWMDSMTTGMSLFEGSCAQDGKEVTVYGKMLDPMSGQVKLVKGVTTVRSLTMYTYESFERASEDDEWTLSMRAIFNKLQ